LEDRILELDTYRRLIAVAFELFEEPSLEIYSY
jgi:hypothetical protein